MNRSLKYRKGNNTPPNKERVVLLFQRGAWMDDAACKDADITLFYDPEDERPEYRVRRIEAAKAICHTCTVRLQCLSTALANDEPFGIWGGLTAAERHAVAREGITHEITA